jgi:hypothetical protein
MLHIPGNSQILAQAQLSQLLYFEVAKQTYTFSRLRPGNPIAKIATGVLKAWTLKFGLFGGLKILLEEYYYYVL